MHPQEVEDSLTQLIATLERCSFPQESNIKQPQIGEHPSSPLISPIQLYRTGLVLYESPNDEHLIQAYQQLIGRIPHSYLCQVLLHELNQSYATVVSSSLSKSSSSMDAVITASQALAGVYCSSPRACQAGNRTSILCLIKTLGVAYDYMLRKSSATTTNKAEIIILQLLSAILMDGLLVTSSDTSTALNTSTTDGVGIVIADDEENRLQTIMEAIQMLTADEKNTCLADLEEMQSRSSTTTPNTTTMTLRSRIKTVISATPQRDYLLQMIAASSKKKYTTASTTLKKAAAAAAASPNNKLAPVIVDPRDEIRRRIGQVQLVLPHLGEGYVEAALSAFQGNVERTVAALLDDERLLPPMLQKLDPTLPGLMMESTPNGYINDDDEARQIAKNRIRKMEQDQEAEAYALTTVMRGVTSRASEYDDDYDDQYDDFDGGVAVGDEGGLDVDLDTVKMYNRVARESEKEVTFWNENRNTNRVQNNLGKAKRETVMYKDNGDDDDVEEEGAADVKQFRGPEKIKGGRPIGPDGKVLPRQKGGKQAAARTSRTTPTNTPSTTLKGGMKTITTGSPSAAAPSPHGETELTKLQKRRKMLNKAKTGNHHRKDAAQRKTGGMG